MISSAHLAPPKEGRIHLVQVAVTQDIDWLAAIKLGAPETPCPSTPTRWGERYPAVGVGTVLTTMVLVNFGNQRDCIAKFTNWGRKYGLPTAHPRQVFAIGEQHPKLLSELGVEESVTVVPVISYDLAVQDLVPGVHFSTRGERSVDSVFISNYALPDRWYAFPLV